MIIRPFTEKDLPAMRAIWNDVVRKGRAFPQEKELTAEESGPFFAAQSRSAVAVLEDGTVAGLYILHPNNLGRCGHIANASYAVAEDMEGRHVGEALVKDSIREAGRLGFRILQFNAVAASNIHARHLYERIGFHMLGTVKGGFRHDDGHYEDICLYWIETV